MYLPGYYFSIIERMFLVGILVWVHTAAHPERSILEVIPEKNLVGSGGVRQRTEGKQ